MKIKHQILGILAVVIGITLNSCSVTSDIRLYSESSINPQEVRVKTAAILPNRMPMNLQNPEYWRSYNYKLIEKELSSRGIRVVEYDMGNAEFLRSGLPMEDTKSSRDKYAELAQKLNADMLIFPYYGTMMTMGGCFYAQNYVYTGLGSLQIYNPAFNDFATRIDFEGINKRNKIIQLVPFLGVLFAIAEGIKGDKPYYEEAFQMGIKSAFNDYFTKYPASAGNSAGEVPTNGSNKYQKYNLEELEILKKAAVGNGDYKTAGEIKEEMDKRKK
jgi:hypothetical protein